ncbi:hypothetical protein D6C76_10540 [Aureobasidium pullulans]|nr:hypothetical protein D6C76_10540 [Aureobasidium pullulans]
MSDENKSSEPENVPEHICALFHQLNPEHIINGIKKTVSGDIEHLFDMARSRELNAGTIIMLFDEAMKTRTGHVTLIALAAAALVVCIVMLVYPMSVAAPFLGALGFTHAGPAAGSIAAAYQSTFGANAMFATLQSAAMGGYGTPVVVGCVQGTAAAMAGWGTPIVIGCVQGTAAVGAAAAAGVAVHGFNMWKSFDGWNKNR